MSRRIVVLGGGISGLSAAFHARELARERGDTVELTVLERSLRAGGCIHTVREEGFSAELGPDALLAQKPHIATLFARLGLADALIEQQPAYRGACVVHDARFVRIPSDFRFFAPTSLGSLARSRLFSPLGMLRAAAEPFIPSRRDDRDESVASFVTRRFGREVFERLAQPLVGGIYSGDPARLSVRATLPFMRDFERERGSVTRGLLTSNPSSPGAHTLSSLRNGLGMLVDALERELSRSMRLGMHATALQRRDGAWIVTTSCGDEIVADGVICALPAHATAPLLEGLAPQLAREMRAIRYNSIATISLAYPADRLPALPKCTGFIVPAREDRSVISVTFSSQKFAGRAPEGTVLLRAFVGGAMQPHLLEHDDDAIVAMVRRELRALAGIDTIPLWQRVKRWNAVLPEYGVGHVERVQRIEREARWLPKFALAGSAYHGAGIPDCVASGYEAARRM